MKKKIIDCTHKDFLDWADRRCCDGQWSLADAIICSKIAEDLYSIKPLFGRKKAREKKWKELAKETFNPDAEIDVES